ncbi:MAG: hypothetical protein GY782_10220 [Gammaproteobacteria bacterium]|nr:hypothetical protein [Gammaproteobacteria bacterium]
MKFRELMKSLVPWPFRQTGRLKICAYCGLRASAFGFPWPAAIVIITFFLVPTLVLIFIIARIRVITNIILILALLCLLIII